MLYFKSRNVSFLILAIAASVSSRLVFTYWADPEGPNLLVTTGLSVVVFVLTLAAYYSLGRLVGLTRLLVALAIQILLVVGVAVWGK
ncbi:MAG: hypothetical protein J0M24_18940 [Verrucomicrobia bacterium]|nr:hypothetical protein [Verrucomicrobiota bacterium]